jgi:hypothetical protein
MAFINRIRLPITVSKPLYIDERLVYRKANGVTKVLSNVVRKQYQAVTDYLPEKLHDRLKIALAHQNVSVEGEKYLGGVSQDGEYTITWPDFLDYPLGRAEFKLEVTPFNASSDNCGICQDLNQVVTNDDDIGTVGEDETVDIAILYNDQICCSPFQISLLSFNLIYVDSAQLIGNVLRLHTKTGIPTQFNVALATYRVTCDNGQFDEATVYADVEGSTEQCFSPTGLVASAITSMTVHLDWISHIIGGCGFNWFLYALPDLGTPVQSGSTGPFETEVDLTGLTPSTMYRFFVQGDCCDSSLSPMVSVDFTTNPPSEADVCGAYTIEFQDSCGTPAHYGAVEYLDCNDEYQSVNVFYLASPTNVCMKQTSPGNPVYYNLGSSNAPVECDIGVFVTYVGPC